MTGSAATGPPQIRLDARRDQHAARAYVIAQRAVVPKVPSNPGNVVRPAFMVSPLRAFFR